MTNLSKKMKTAQEMQAKMAAAQKEFETLEVEGQAGGGRRRACEPLVPMATRVSPRLSRHLTISSAGTRGIPLLSVRISATTCGPIFR